MSDGHRRLAVIMFTDMVGYTALSQKDEASAMKLLEDQRRLVRPYFSKHGGREVKTIGDAFLVEFESALNGTMCAFDIQQSLHELNLSRPTESQIFLRIGVHLGDVIHNQDDVYGDAVNIASRIEPLAPAGGVCITEQVNDQIKNKSDIQMKSLGRKELKNVGEAVAVFQMVFPWDHQDVRSEGLDKKRIAILPFVNLSSDPEEGYFADGMTEELITSLSGVRQLTVIARTSIMKYKGSQKGASDIGKELNAGTLLEGSVRKSGNRVRITAQLVDAASDGHLWAQNYDRQLEDVFAIQSEISEKVAGELKIRLIDSEKRVIEKKATENTEAYTYFLKGKELIRELSERSLRQAESLFEKAIEQDPSFAKAYSGLAECLISLANDVYEPYERVVPKAEIAAKKALQLDAELAEAHGSLSFVYFLEDYFAECELEAKRAVELNPSIPEGYFILSLLAFESFEPEKGLKYLETAHQVDPGSTRYIERLGSFYFYCGKEDEANSFWDKTLQLAPAGTFRNKTEYHLCKGNFDLASEFFSKAKEIEPTNPWVTWMEGFISAKRGNKEGALKAMHKIEENWTGAVDLNGIAFLHYALGDLDSYFTYISKVIDQHLVQFRYVLYSPLFSEARKDQRYQLLVNKFKNMHALVSHQ